ncbi:iron-siderophore ABC transporter substrate-binding protein [Providencia sp. Je.9.19]|uniref:iron-siderophore ABC transporter substrate-binding protein n=1 Tax=Providencia sp. Je.9.19 TaxID=3142844 RepID=UPI003DA95CA9
MRLIPLPFTHLIVLFSLLFSSLSFAEITINDDRSTQTFITSPERIVVLDWDLLEQVLSLDIIPVGATEINSYNQWVVMPAAPESIDEVGTRAEPNLEKIASLKPDVILATSAQQDLIPLLQRIAPVVYLTNFSAQDDAAIVAIRHFKTLATLFNKQQQAEKQLAQLDKQFELLRAKLAQVYPNNTEVTVIRFSTLTSVFLPTENASINYVLQRLGLKPAVKLPARPWGITQRRINELSRIDDGYVLFLRPFPDEKKLADARLWQAMPFVQKNQVNGVIPVWNYGGVYSLQRMAQAITDSLLEIAPAP